MLFELIVAPREHPESPVDHLESERRALHGL